MQYGPTVVGRRRRAAFTLVEICVAAFLLALAFGAVFATLSSSRQSLVMAENRLVAVHEARAAMEGLRRSSYSAPELAAGTWSLLGGRGRYVVTDMGDGWNKNVDVQVDWQDFEGRTHTVTLTTTVSRSLHK